ncbi:Aste57867_10431 [Aphanomyces stellatus]|uniref:Aste57867_10431 protein n=1 Tax=Aphanomyces stellatus TaxID=120398 RepID=A0A485KQB9_9STRA|nr:hypothetical protein As57867_010391 [Aphanomyces stellatus]VFT87305.1 Aste57867_10431 [Aphanomyces stellatus]
MGIYSYTIIDATKSGDVSKVRERLAAGDDVNEETLGLTGATSLILATASGNQAIIELKRYYPVVADPETLGVENLEKCFGLDRYFARLLQCTALEVAAANGDMAIAKMLVEDGKALAAPGDPQGWAMYYAALHLHYDMVLYLFNNARKIPLALGDHIRGILNQWNVAGTSITDNRDPHVAFFDGIFLEADLSNLDRIKAIPMVVVAICDNEYAAAKFLFAVGEPLDMTTRAADVAVERACYKGFEMFKLVWDHAEALRTNPSMVFARGMTALHMAAWADSLEIDDFLLSHGADPTTKDQLAGRHKAIWFTLPSTDTSDANGAVVSFRVDNSTDEPVNVTTSNYLDYKFPPHSTATLSVKPGVVITIAPTLAFATLLRYRVKAGDTSLEFLGFGDGVVTNPRAPKPDPYYLADEFPNAGAKVQHLLKQATKRAHFDTNVCYYLDATKKLDLAYATENMVKPMRSLRDLSILIALEKEVDWSWADQKTFLTKAFEHILEHKMVLDDEDAGYFTVVLKECRRRGYLKKLEYEVWEKKNIKVNVASAPWLADIKHKIESNERRITNSEANLQKVAASFNQLKLALKQKAQLEAQAAKRKFLVSAGLLNLAVDNSSDIVDLYALAFEGSDHVLSTSSDFQRDITARVTSKTLRPVLTPAVTSLLNRSNIDPNEFVVMLGESVTLSAAAAPPQQQQQHVPRSTTMPQEPLQEPGLVEGDENESEYHIAVAASKGDVDAFEETIDLLDETDGNINDEVFVATFGCKMTPLVYASYLGYVDLVKYLLKRSDVQATEKKALTLSRAKSNGTMSA